MSDQQKYQGTVKWFSNRKGYGFITPGEGCPITDDIFVHQSTVHSEGYRTLSEGWTVEFAVGRDDDGKAKAENVTAPGGGYCTGPRRPHHGPRRRGSPRKGGDDAKDHHEDEEAHEEGDEAEGEGGEAKEGEEKAAGEGGAGGGGGGRRGGRRRGSPRRKREGGGADKHWHDSLSDSVKKSLDDKGVRRTTGTVDVALGTSRIKLGTRGYASAADSRALLAEGSFECGEDGRATFDWKRALKFEGEEWIKMDEKGGDLPASLTLDDDAVGAVGTEETAATLWGDGPADPRHALEENGFEMRRVVLTTKRR